jgi:hypothetical protein
MLLVYAFMVWHLGTEISFAFTLSVFSGIWMDSLHRFLYCMDAI